MARPRRKGVEEARNEFPALLAEAQQGRATVITRHGREIAAIVPVEGLLARQRPLNALAGSGKGLWGRDSTRMLRRLREEWER